MKIEIKNRWTGTVVVEGDFSSLAECLNHFVGIRADLSGADLRGANLSMANLSRANLSRANLSMANLSRADLSGADLRGANLSMANLSRANLSRANLSRADLSEANLSWANLSGANLSWADLREADLREADLSEANLSMANLSRADLRGANLRGANLRGADLSRANLSRANLSRANLSPIKEDFYKVLKLAPNEVLGLRLALLEGRVNGSTYEGDCACLVGTIANIRHCKYYLIPSIQPDSSRPIERLFLAIRTGDTPANSQACAIIVTWIDEWLAINGGSNAPTIPSV